MELARKNREFFVSLIFWALFFLLPFSLLFFTRFIDISIYLFYFILFFPFAFFTFLNKVNKKSKKINFILFIIACSLYLSFFAYIFINANYIPFG